MMTKTNSVAAIDPSQAEAETAIKALQHAGFGLREFSMVGRDHHPGEPLPGYRKTGDRMKCRSRAGALRGGK